MWFIIGALVGTILLGGLVSCSTIERAENAVGSVDAEIRDVPVIGAVYAIPSDVVGGVYGLGESVVEGAVELVTPDEEEVVEN